MAFTKNDLDAINEAIAGGELEVSIGDRRIKYRSLAELIEARKIIQSDLNDSNSKPSGSLRSYRVNVSKL